MRIGFFREMPHGDPAGLSLAEACYDTPAPNEENVAAYLEQGHVRIAATGITYDVFDPDILVGAPHQLTDGRFEWPGDLAYYVRKYHLRLQAPFIAHMQANAWQVPSEVDVTVPLPTDGVRWTDVRWMASPEEVTGCLSRLVPHDANSCVYEIIDKKLAQSALRQLSVYQRLIASAAAGPFLWDEIRMSFGYNPPVWAIAEHLRDQFPPKEPIPAVIPSFPPELTTAIQQIADGEPGDPVVYGLSPSRPTKLARLLLARAGVYPADNVLRAAKPAYDRDRSDINRSYPAHDAFACALVHPHIDAVELAEWHARQPWDHRGRNFRRKRNRLLAWARLHGYLPDPSGCPCGHHKFTAPQTMRTAMALSRHQDKIKNLLEVLERDSSRWLGVSRCARCGSIWAEDSISSGQASMFYCYPIKTDDPRAWLSHAEPLEIRSW
ncbi:hypothetical protein ACWCQZ_50315 [Streptomyces sp. NPDC002285]